MSVDPELLSRMQLSVQQLLKLPTSEFSLLVKSKTGQKLMRDMRMCVDKSETLQLLEIAETKDSLLPHAKQSRGSIKNTVPSPDKTKSRYRPAIIPLDEKERIKTLRETKILDTVKEDIYDNILWLATRVCDTEMGAVSLVDTDRQWFKSEVGLNTTQTGRDEAFCSHAILDRDNIFVVENTLADDRFAENPLVLGGPKIRFYAGVPMTLNDSTIGTLCVISGESKKLTPRQLSALRVLGTVCKDQLRLRSKNIEMAGLIGDLRKSEEYLIAAKEKAQMLANERTQFLANMTHELRTPLNGIIGFSTMLAEQKHKLPSEAIDYIESIQFGSKVLTNTVNSVLDFTKLESGKWSLDLVKTDIRDMLHKIIDLNESVAKRRGVALILKIDETIHKGTEIDKTKLIQVINNLLSNAIKFTKPSKRVFLEIERISSDVPLELPKGIINRGGSKFPKGNASMKFHYMNVTVRDEGVGIAEDKLEKIFESFQQEKASTARTHGGTGLGLAIVKGMVEMSKGRIYVDSSQDKKDSGSKFSIFMPYKKCIPYIEKLIKASQIHKLPETVSIMIAEDDHLSQKLLKRFMKKQGVPFQLCENGKILVDAVAKKLKEDSKGHIIIFTDIGMPVMDGLQALEKLRKMTKDIYTHRIYITALTASPEALLEKNPGFDKILGKPLEYKELIQSINSFLDHLEGGEKR